MIFGAFLSQAQQPTPGAAAHPSMFMSLLPLIVIFGIFYLILILPQRKKQKKHMEMVEKLKAGDRIITTAGIFGTVMGVQKDRIELKIAANTKIDIAKSAVGVILGATDAPPDKTG
jgi:preprotein translocase subunit YajC